LKKKFVALLSAATLVGGMTIGASAAPVLEKITAHLNWGITYEVNGKQWTPKDQSGNRIAAISYNNTTYLPVRAVSDALGVAVEYDNKAQKIKLGEKSDKTPITSEDIKLSYDSVITKDKQHTVHNGKDYGSGVLLNNVNIGEKRFTLKPGGKHQTLELSVLPVKVTKEILVKIMSGDVLLKEVVISPSDSIQTVTVDIDGAKEIEVSAKYAKVEIGDDTLFFAGTYK